MEREDVIILISGCQWAGTGIMGGEVESYDSVCFSEKFIADSGAFARIGAQMGAALLEQSVQRDREVCHGDAASDR